MDFEIISFQIFIYSSPKVDILEDVYECDNYILPELTDGRYFTDEDMEDYIYWFVSGHRSFVDEIKLRVTIEECEEIKKKDAYVDWNYCSWSWFKNLRTTGAFYNNNIFFLFFIVTPSSTH